MNMVCLTRMYVVVAFLFAILCSLCNKHNHTLTLNDVESAGLIKKTVHGLQDGTEDLNSFQLHSWQWRESTRTPPSYLGTTWSWLNWTLELGYRTLSWRAGDGDSRICRRFVPLLSATSATALASMVQKAPTTPTRVCSWVILLTN